MKERPILFSGPMVRAIIEGRKTQTRRMLRWKPREDGINLAFSGLESGCYSNDNPASGYVLRSRGYGSCWNDRTWPAHCPYGLAGDRLWVHETWGLHARGDETDWFRYSTRGYTEDQIRAAHNLTFRADWGPLQEGCFWRPAISLPRWASRLTLEVTDVRVQRLQEISEDDARAEGVAPYTPPHGHISPDQRVPGPGFERCRLGDQPHRLPFADLWDSINGKRAAWESNPWVWAITFKRLP